MKLDDIEDRELRKQMAGIQLAYWDECTKAAAGSIPIGR